MRKLYKYSWLFLLSVAFVGCDEFFEPNYNNNMDEETVFDYNLNPEYVAGLFVPAYNAIPGSYQTFGGDFLDCATDNAVSNSYTSASWKMHTINNYYLSSPKSVWSNRYRYIRNVFEFMSVGLNDDIVYRTTGAERSEQIKQRMEGEAHFLLALNYFQLLKNHAGPVDGVIKGVPLITSLISEEEAKNMSRAEYDEVLAYIVERCEYAASNGLLPEYTDAYATGQELDATVYGDGAAGLPTTTACYMVKSYAQLYAASPAFSIGKSDAEVKELYRQAALSAKQAIDNVGELAMVYGVNNVDAQLYGKPDGNPEYILRRAINTKSWEQSNYPPSLYLSVYGRTNPSQNLVDAFPMANGYPIADGAANYNANNPYVQRDPRFYMTVLYNNVNFKGKNLEMWDGGNTQVGANNIPDDSRTSRTNYYLRKHLTETPQFISGQGSETPWHACAMFRSVEAYLIFAEAANAAVGPDTPIDGLTAREALRKIRYRAGIPSGAEADIASDPYLAGLSDLTELIKNERRIELCFEGHRYYDIRRWGDDLNTIVRKASVSTDDNGATFNYNFNESVYPTQATFPEHMRYGSIPRSEVLICDKLEQNDGWN